MLYLSPECPVSVTPLPRQHGLLPGPPRTVLLHHLGNCRTLRPLAGSRVPCRQCGVLPQVHQRQRRQSSRSHTAWREMAAHLSVLILVLLHDGDGAVHRSVLLSHVLHHDGDGAAAVFQGITHTSLPSLASLSLISLYHPHILLCSN